MNRSPRSAYVVAVILGLFAAFAPANLPLADPSFGLALLISSGIFGVLGFLLGVVWPNGRWRWGLWLIAPGLLLVTLGVISSRNFGRFFGDDLPFLVCGCIAAGLGGVLGARLRSPTSSAGDRSE